MCSPHLCLFLSIHSESVFQIFDSPQAICRSNPPEKQERYKARGNKPWSAVPLVPLVQWNVSLLSHIKQTQNNVVFNSTFTSSLKKIWNKIKKLALSFQHSVEKKLSCLVNIANSDPVLAKPACRNAVFVVTQKRAADAGDSLLCSPCRVSQPCKQGASCEFLCPPS